jgi:heavy metal sensor kinase
MHWLKTLRARFALWVAALLLLVFVAFGVFVYVSLGQGLYASVDTSLQVSASQAIAAVNIENGQINFADSLPETSAVAGLRDRGLTIRILTPAGQSLSSLGPYRSLPVTGESLAAARAEQSTFATVSAPGEPYLVRFYTAPIAENGQLIGIVQVAQSLATTADALNRLLTTLLVAGPLLVIAAALGGYFLAARALAPIDHITHTARRISAQDLSARLNLPATDDEVGRLASTFDAMLARLDGSFRRQRQFTADASHELRTPLAAMQAILSVTREQRRTPEVYELALGDLSEEADRLQSLVKDLLRLARSDAPATAPRERIDLSSLLRDVTESLSPLAETKGLRLTSSVPAGLALIGDSDSLIRLFVNLLDNAVKYTEHGSISLRAGTKDHRLRVVISDTGVGISPQHLPHIFDRFYRADASRASRGTGLGLAIALEIAQAHGGTIKVNSRAGAGTTFTVSLPI